MARDEDTTIVVEFAPSEVGSVSGSITFVSNDTDEPNFLVGLIATGLEPSVISVNPTSFDFGVIIPGDTLTTDFTIQNNGGSELIWDAGLMLSEDRANGSRSYNDLRAEYAMSLFQDK